MLLAAVHSSLMAGFPGSQLPVMATQGIIPRTCLTVKRYSHWATGLLPRVLDVCFAVSCDIFLWFDWPVLLCLLKQAANPCLEESVWFSSLQTCQCSDFCIPVSSPYLPVKQNLHMQYSLALWEIFCCCLALCTQQLLSCLKSFVLAVVFNLWSVPWRVLDLFHGSLWHKDLTSFFQFTFQFTVHYGNKQYACRSLGLKNVSS